MCNYFECGQIDQMLYKEFFLALVVICSAERNHLALRNIGYHFILILLDSAVQEMYFKRIFILYLALAAILFGGAKSFGQFW